MKAFITTGVLVAAIVAGVAAPVNATGVFGGAAMGGNSNFHLQDQGSYGWHFGPDGVTAHFDYEATTCSEMNWGAQGGFGFGDATPIEVAPTSVQSANLDNCDANQVVNNPPANTTVTINNICGDPAELAKLAAAHGNLIINSTGVCKPNQPTTPVVTVTPNAPQPNQVVTAAATTVTANPKAGNGSVGELPQTGTNEVMASVVATILAGSAYAGTMAIRALRANS